jgi:hypothetical protein
VCGKESWLDNVFSFNACLHILTYEIKKKSCVNIRNEQIYIVHTTSIVFTS